MKGICKSNYWTLRSKAEHKDYHCTQSSWKYIYMKRRQRELEQCLCLIYCVQIFGWNAERFIEKNSNHCFSVEKIKGTFLLTSRLVSTIHKTCFLTSRMAFRTKISPNGYFSSVSFSLPPTHSDSDSTNCLWLTLFWHFATCSYYLVWFSLQLPEESPAFSFYRDLGKLRGLSKAWSVLSEELGFWHQNLFFSKYHDLCSFLWPLSPFYQSQWVVSTFRYQTAKGMGVRRKIFFLC